VLQVCWIPVFKAKKLILAGDPKQLPPTVLSLTSSREHASRHQYHTMSKPYPPLPSSGTANPAPRLDGSCGADDTGENEQDSWQAEVDCTHDTRRSPSNADPGSCFRSLTLPRTLELTMFERLEKMYGPRIKCMLTVQYRYLTRPQW
jgi:DNA polymerase alpha-associated DNA helicase A